MEDQKVIITKSQTEINRHLEEGWKILSVTPQQVSTGGGSHIYGDFLIVLHRPIEMI
jgi:hypothetical protein